MADKPPVDHSAKRAAERRKRQAEALRLNLKRRKQVADPETADDTPDIHQ